MADTRALFVYGTLRPGFAGAFGAAMRQRLSAEGDWIGAAALEGQLFDLGRYPGVVEHTDVAAKSTVAGDVLSLREPEMTWPWLDRYEGIDPVRPESSEYERVVRPVKLMSGELVDAWVYLLARYPEHGRLIAPGDWLDDGESR